MEQLDNLTQSWKVILLYDSALSSFSKIIVQCHC